MNKIFYTVSVASPSDYGLMLSVPGPLENFIPIHPGRSAFINVDDDFPAPAILAPCIATFDSAIDRDTMLAVYLLAKMRHNREVKMRSGWNFIPVATLLLSARICVDRGDYLDAGIYYLMAHTVADTPKGAPA